MTVGVHKAGPDNTCSLFGFYFLPFSRFASALCYLRYFFSSSENVMDLLLDLWFLLDCVPRFVFKFMLRSLIFCLDLEFDLL